VTVRKNGPNFLGPRAEENELGDQLSGRMFNLLARGAAK
jgi:hypothetical protein